MLGSFTDCLLRDLATLRKYKEGGILSAQNNILVSDDLVSSSFDLHGKALQIFRLP